MAQLIAKMALTFPDLNLNGLLSFLPFRLERDADVTYRGEVYRDVLYGDDDGRTIYFGGEDLAFSGSQPSGGRLRAITIEEGADRDVFSRTAFDTGFARVGDLMIWVDGNWLCLAYASGQIRLKGYTQDDLGSDWFDFA